MPGLTENVNSSSLNIQNGETNGRENGLRRLWGDLPHIPIEILGDKYPCLADSGCTVGVISEALFQTLRTKDPRMQILPTAGIVCSGALRRQKQRVKYQVMIQAKIGTGSYEVVFLVVPGLGPEIILGVDLMESWKAKLDFEHFHMKMATDNAVETVPFMEDDVGQTQASVAEPGLESELFFVEKVAVYDHERVAIVECLDQVSYERNLPCNEVERGLFLFSEKDECVNDLSYLNDEVQILSIQADDRTFEILKRKVDEIEGITDVQKQKFYRVFQENINVFSDEIGLCNAYVHEFHVINPTPYHHKCRN